MKERNKFSVLEFCGTVLVLLIYGAYWLGAGLLVGIGRSTDQE